MTVPTTAPRLDHAVRAFCGAVGAPDLETWLGIPLGQRGAPALRALEQRRISLERRLSDPQAAREAELLIDSYDALVRWLHQTTPLPAPEPLRLPRRAADPTVERAPRPSPAPRGAAWTGPEALAVVAWSVALVAGGWWLGARTGRAHDAPASVGTLVQVPTIAACVDKAPEPRPRYVDVHTDGLGRPSGYALGSPAAPTLEACIKDALVHLEFPPNADGLPAFHRYYLSEDAAHDR